MASSRLRYEDGLEGAVNFSPWKERIVLLLEEIELWDIIEKEVTMLGKTANVTGFEFY